MKYKILSMSGDSKEDYLIIHVCAASPDKAADMVKEVKGLLATKPESDKEKCECICHSPKHDGTKSGWCQHCVQEELGVEEVGQLFIGTMLNRRETNDVIEDKINELVKAHNALLKEVRAIGKALEGGHSHDTKDPLLT